MATLARVAACVALLLLTSGVTDAHAQGGIPHHPRLLAQLADRDLDAVPRTRGALVDVLFVLMAFDDTGCENQSQEPELIALLAPAAEFMTHISTSRPDISLGVSLGRLRSPNYQQMRTTILRRGCDDARVQATFDSAYMLLGLRPAVEEWMRDEGRR